MPPRRFSSPRARLRARELHVDLESLRGTGPGGRIVEQDVLVRAETGSENRGRIFATPLARRTAREHQVSLETVTATGPNGRIVQEDVLRAAAQPRPAPAVAQPPAAPAPAAQTTPAAPASAALQGDSEVRALSRTRRITAERMAQSAHTVARVTLHLEADLTEASRFRQQIAPELARLGVPRLPWDALLARAAGLALLEHPAVNASWVEGQGIRLNQGAHVGIAVAIEPEGLVVPILRDAGTRSLRQLAADLLELATQARAGRLPAAAMQGGSFTITNLGAYRIDGFTPIINPPETAILGVGRIAEKPAVVEGRLEVRTLCTLSLSFDHRVVDGAPAAAFLARLAELLERPYALLGL